MNPPDNTSPSPFDLNTATIEQANRQRRSRQIGYLMAFLLIAILAHGVFQRDKPKDVAQGGRVEMIEDAFRETKFVYAKRVANGQLSLNVGRADKAQAASMTYTREVLSALQKWHDITKMEVARPSDWRRFGIAQAVFGQPEALRTFQHIPVVPIPNDDEDDAPQPTTDAKPIKSIVKPKIKWKAKSAQPDVPPAQEVALWEAIYGPKPLRAKQVPALRATLLRLELRWFEPVALTDLYAKAGMRTEARHAEEAAQASIGYLNAFSNFEWLAFLFGFPALFFYYGYLLRKPNPRLEAATPSFDLPSGFSLPALPNGPQGNPPLRFSYHARMIAFVAYMGLPLLLALPLGPLFDTMKDWSYLALERLEIVLESGLSWLLLLLTLLLLRRVNASENTEAGSDNYPVPAASGPTSRPSLRAMLGILGLRSDRVGLDLFAGLIGYTTTIPLLLIASLVSNKLFSHFQTPTHPVLLSIVEMNTPLDRLMLLFETAITAPIVEELMFRGLLYPALRQRWGVWGGIAISSAIFALVHPTLPGGFIPLWTLGACFAFTYERRGSLLPNIIMHAMNNGLLLLMQFAALSK